jgi:hypothetical protein
VNANLDNPGASASYREPIFSKEMTSLPEKIRVEGIVELEWDAIVNPYPDEKKLYVYYSDRKILGINWSRNASWVHLGQPAKRQGASFNAKYWVFPKGAEDFLRKALSHLPHMEVVRCDANIGHYRYAHADLGSHQVLAVRLPVPLGLPGYDEPLPDDDGEKRPSPRRYWRMATNQGEWVAINDLGHIKVVLEFLRGNAAQDVHNLWDFHGDSKVKLEVAGWAVIAQCDLANPRHFLLQPPQGHKWSKRDDKKIYIPWGGEVATTRKGWPELEQKLSQAGIEWTGDDPIAPLSVRVQGDVAAAPGCTTAAPNGFVLHDYQKKGIQFCLDRGMRAAITDEMGLGKTVQGIGAAVASHAKKILVVAPANARWVWDREIRSWTGTNSISHLETALSPLENAEWQTANLDARRLLGKSGSRSRCGLPQVSQGSALSHQHSDHQVLRPGAGIFFGRENSKMESRHATPSKRTRNQSRPTQIRSPHRGRSPPHQKRGRKAKPGAGATVAGNPQRPASYRHTHAE